VVDDPVRRRIARIVTLVLGADPRDDPTLQAGSSPEWDSLRHIEIILAVEDEFGVTIPETAFGSMSSIDALANCVASLRAAQ
jgi:acyl carrier protein